MRNAWAALGADTLVVRVVIVRIAQGLLGRLEIGRKENSIFGKEVNALNAKNARGFEQGNSSKRDTCQTWQPKNHLRHYISENFQGNPIGAGQSSTLPSTACRRRDGKEGLSEF